MLRALPCSLLLVAGLASAAPTERRLHIGQAEASSYDKNDWNHFEENYLPLYVADDDPKTAWTEGVPGDGAGEWIRMHVSPMKGATKVRVKLRNGYQKSDKLFLANARAKKVVVKLLPGGKTLDAELADKQGWQELTLAQPAGELSGVELKVVSAFPGKKYADLCISDVQLFVTADTTDNPAYEKSVFERVKKWKTERVAAAVAFKAAAAGKPIPLAPAYSSGTETQLADGDCKDEWCGLAADVGNLTGPSLGAEQKAAIAFLAAAAKNKLAEFQPVQVVVDKAKQLPQVDGTCAPSIESCSFDYCSDPMLPIDHMSLMRREDFRILERKEAETKEVLLDGDIDKVKACRREEPTTYAWAARTGADKRVQALLVYRCKMIEGREGSYPGRTWQLLVYDDAGRLRVTANRAAAATYRWEAQGATERVSGGSFVVSSVRTEFTANPEVAQNN